MDMEVCKRFNAKKFAISVLIAIGTIGIAVSFICFLPDITDCGSFSLQTYSEELQTDGFMSDKNYDKIDNYREAAKCAETLLKEDFDSLSLNKYRTEVYFDEESEVWLVYYTLKSIYVYNELSADYYVILSTNGDVIARWGVK